MNFDEAYGTFKHELKNGHVLGKIMNVLNNLSTLL